MRSVTYWSVVVTTVICIAACSRRGADTHYQETAKLRQQVEDAIQLGDKTFADSIISHELAAATDSDYYYLWLSTRNKEFYAAYAVDSLVRTSERIHQYLLRNGQRTNIALRRLRTEWLMARGVFHAALTGRPDSGIAYMDSAIRLLTYPTAGDRQEAELRVIAMTNKADFYRQTGQLDLSADGYLQALAVADSFHTGKNSRIAINLGIATDFTFMADYASSAAWWDSCRQLLPQMEKPDQFIYYNNRGNDYYLQQQYKEALPCFEQAAALVKDDEGKTWDYQTARTNIAEILINLGEADKARPILAEVDSFFRQVNLDILLYYIETSKLKLTLLEGRTAEAAQMARRSQTPDGVPPAAKVMRLQAVEQVLRQAGDYGGAYAAHEQLHALNDSIKSTQVRMQLSTRLIAYEHDKRIAEQQRQIEHGQMTNRLAWALFLAALLAVILLVVLYLLHRRRGYMQALMLRQELMETRLTNVRNRLSPHFIYNALSHEQLAQMDGKAVNFDTLIQLLRRGLAMADTLQTSLQQELAFVDYYVAIEGQSLGGDFIYNKVIDEGIDTAQVFLPSMTLQIFAENAIKHGLRPMATDSGRKGTMRLTIRVSRQGDATLVEVLDNGGGLRGNINGSEHTGLRVVRQTVQLLNEHNATPIDFGIGNWQEESEGGCRAWILLPDGGVTGKAQE